MAEIAEVESPDETGKGWFGERERHSEAGKKCVESPRHKAHDREHMAEIGRRGGLRRSRDREEMVRIGRLGGLRKKVAAETEPKE